MIISIVRTTNCICLTRILDSHMQTYTMGVLEFVNNKNAGIIPRTLARIFDYAQEEMATHNTIVKVRLSFLQLYRETIQDLLAQLSTASTSSSQQSIGTTDGSNLAIREDPLKGFYVEGLQEFEVASYSEAGTCFRKNVKT
jgi:Kinesin motor domain